jgi:signal transduction histidine kinase
VPAPDPTPAPARPLDQGIGRVSRHERFSDGLIRPFLTLAVIVVTAFELPNHHLVAPVPAVTLFVLVAALAVATLFPWTPIPQPAQAWLLAVYAIAASVLLSLAHTTTAAAVFAFLASGVAGGKLASQRVAVGVATAGAVTAAVLAWVVSRVDPAADEWPWWLALSVGLPVYIGISRRDRMNALFSAQRAVAETERASASEAREAALEERGRIAREIHDVLGHSLSGIALQLDMADALHGSGREEEATRAVRRARALAVDSITETRRAVQALREDTLPLPETLRLLAAGDLVAFEVRGTPAPVPVEVSHTVIRAAQEALTNSLKYAPGADRSMTLAFTPDAVRLTVANGPSTAPRTPDIAGGTGMGLIGMRERVALLEGTLRAGPTADDAGEGGWTVRVEIPL